MLESLIIFNRTCRDNLTANFATGEITGACIRWRHTIIGVNIYIGVPAVHGSHHGSHIRPVTSISGVRRRYRPHCQSTTYWTSTRSAHEERNPYRAIYTLRSTVNMCSKNILDIGHIDTVAERRSIFAQLEGGNACRIGSARWDFMLST